MEQLKRLLCMCAALLAILLLARWLITLPGPVDLGKNFHPALLFHLLLAKRYPLLSEALSILLAVTCVLAAGMALYLMLKAPANRPANLLARAFSLSALGMTHFSFIGAYPEFRHWFGLEGNLVWQAALDMCAYAAIAVAMHAIWLFFRIFPRPVDEAGYRAHFIAQNERAYRAMSVGWRRHVYPKNMWLDALPESQKAGAFKFFLGIQQGAQRQLKMHRWMDGNGYLAVTLACAPLLAGLQLFVRMKAAMLAPGEALPKLAEFALTAGLFPFMLLIVAPLAVAFESFLRYHHLHGSAEDRAKVDWVYFGVLVAFVATSGPAILGLAAIIVFAALPDHLIPNLPMEMLLGGFAGAVGTLTAFALVVSLSLSVMYRGALDPRLAARKFTVWWLLGLLATFLFVLFERAVAMKIVAWLKLSPDTGPLIAGAMVAATIAPVRNKSERWIGVLTARYLPASVVADGVRREAVVVMSDLSGYSALAASNERQSLLAAAVLSQQANACVAEHGGRLVKTMGDAVLLEFADGADALAAVEALHRSCAAAFEALKLPPLPLHSALHSGEITEAPDGDIFGHTVNVTARLQGEAGAGEIVVSQVLKEALGSVDQRVVSMGLRTLKNIPEPMMLFRIQPATA